MRGEVGKAEISGQVLSAVSLPRPILIFTGARISLVLRSTHSKIQPLPLAISLFLSRGGSISRRTERLSVLGKACGKEVDPNRDKVNHHSTASVYRSSTRPRRISGAACAENREY